MQAGRHHRPLAFLHVSESAERLDLALQQKQWTSDDEDNGSDDRAAVQSWMLVCASKTWQVPPTCCVLQAGFKGINTDNIIASVWLTVLGVCYKGK